MGKVLNALDSSPIQMKSVVVIYIFIIIIVIVIVIVQ